MKACEKAKQEISEVIKDAISHLQEEVKEIYTSNLANAYFAFDLTHKAVSIPNLSATEVKTRHRQWKILSQIAEGIDVKLSKWAQDAGAVGKSGLLTAEQVAGSPMHTFVLKVGEFFGIEFEPGQAVNMATDIGNVAKFIGPVAQLFKVCLELKKILEEEEQSKLLSEAKLAVMAQFNEIGQELKREFEDQLQEVEKQTFDLIADEVENAQNAYQKANTTNDETSKALLELREELSALLKANRKAVILD